VIRGPRTGGGILLILCANRIDIAFGKGLNTSHQSLVTERLLVAPCCSVLQ